MRKLLIPLGIVVMLLGLAAPAFATQDDSPNKVFVCKYVGTPGPDERLQTGQNPIDVSINSIPDYQGVGSYFADAQGRSYVLALDVGQDEPDVSACPGFVPPTTTTQPPSDEPPTTTTTEVPTSTTIPDVPTTTEPGPTTTLPPSTSTTSPPTSTTGSPPVTIEKPPVKPTIPAGVTSPSPPAPGTSSTPPAKNLPYTGSNAPALTFIGSLLIGAGLFLSRRFNTKGIA